MFTRQIFCPKCKIWCLSTERVYSPGYIAWLVITSRVYKYLHRSAVRACLAALMCAQPYPLFIIRECRMEFVFLFPHNIPVCWLFLNNITKRDGRWLGSKLRFQPAAIITVSLPNASGSCSWQVSHLDLTFKFIIVYNFLSQMLNVVRALVTCI